MRAAIGERTVVQGPATSVTTTRSRSSSPSKATTAAVPIWSAGTTTDTRACSRQGRTPSSSTTPHLGRTRDNETGDAKSSRRDVGFRARARPLGLNVGPCRGVSLVVSAAAGARWLLRQAVDSHAHDRARGSVTIGWSSCSGTRYRRHQLARPPLFPVGWTVKSVLVRPGRTCPTGAQRSM
jgi:hypothetical protein